MGSSKAKYECKLVDNQPNSITLAQETHTNNVSLTGVKKKHDIHKIRTLMSGNERDACKV